MSTDEIRRLKYLEWRDPYAWMESMKGQKWNNLLKQEKTFFNRLVHQPTVQSYIRDFKEELKFSKQFERQEIFTIGNNSIYVAMYGKSYMWRWKWSRYYKMAFDIDAVGDAVWYTVPYNKTSICLRCETADGKLIWSKTNVSDEVAVIGDLCYYIKTTNVFQTTVLAVCNALTGKDEHIIYREKNPQCYLSLIKDSDKTLAIKSTDSGKSRLFVIEGKMIKELDKDTNSQMSVGRSMGYKDICRYVRFDKADGTFRYEQRGEPFNKWKLPRDEFVEWVSLQGGYIITIKGGSETLWKCGINDEPKQILNIAAGTIIPNPWTNWENQIMPQFFVLTPEHSPCIYHVYGTKKTEIPLLKSPFPDLEVHRSHAKSLDGSKVPYVIVHKKSIKRPVALMVIGYGSYGLSTVVNWPYTLWGPLLLRGWALAFAYVRGGGDDSFEWSEAARRENRHRSVEDFEAVIRAAQLKTHLRSDKTVIYGRSAGGFLVGSVAARHPDGHLMKAVFTEVPYVDVLRTSTNPDLPLTVGEYNEFGNPAKRVIDFQELLHVSPIDNMPIDGAKGLFVLSRTGLLDRQVYAYEPFKWMQHLRGNIPANKSTSTQPSGKYIAFEPDEDHVYSVSKKYDARAVDLAILEAWRTGTLRY
jgi:pimeloyl-ACP methyl ester carboxylesterase